MRTALHAVQPAAAERVPPLHGIDRWGEGDLSTRAQALVDAYRAYGHRAAMLDPLAPEPAPGTIAAALRNPGMVRPLGREGKRIPPHLVSLRLRGTANPFIFIARRRGNSHKMNFNCSSPPLTTTMNRMSLSFESV